MRIPFVGGSNRSRSVSVSAQRTVNMYAEVDPEHKFAAALFARPGSTGPFASTGAAEIRGMAVYSGALYVVVGGELKSVSTAGTVASIGTITTSKSGRVSMAVNKTQLMIVDGVGGWIYNGSTLTQISDGQFPDKATHVVYIDGYFVVNDPDNAGRFNISASEDGTSWDGTDFATAERSPDALKSVVVNNRELWLLGDESSEVWTNTGNPDFPFEPFPSGFTEWGVAAPHSVVSIDGSVLWLAKGPSGDGVVMQSQGLRGVRVSTFGVDEQIGKLTTISDAFGYAFEERGHVFYVLTFPTGDLTLVFHANTGLWYEWNSFGLGRWRPNAHAFFNGNHYTGDYQDGNVFQLDWEAYSDSGTPIERIRQDRAVVSGNLRERLYHRRFEIEFEAGTGGDADPQVMLQWSDDGGHTYSNEHWRGIGKVGEYGSRSVWRSLGRSRDRIYRMKMTDDSKTVIVGAYADIHRGAA